MSDDECDHDWKTDYEDEQTCQEHCEKCGQVRVTMKFDYGD